MVKPIKYISAGHPPDAVIFIGKHKVDKVKLRHISYSKDTFNETGFTFKDELKLDLDDNCVNWINVTGVNNTDLLIKLGKKFDIHPLILADIANTEHSPKIDFMDNQLFMEIKHLELNESNFEVSSNQFSFILGKNFLLSFVEEDTDMFDNVIQRIKANNSKLTKTNADFLLYSLLDTVIDSYYNILEKLGDDIENIEDEILAQPDKKHIEGVHNLKKNLILIRKAVWPLREIIRNLSKDYTDLINPETEIYIRDVYDHIVQLIETVEMQREIVAEIFNIYLSSVSQRLNEVMKVLTIIATIFIPLTFISSIYGMNFLYMPELKWIYGYPLIMGIMFSAGLTMLIYFKIKKWF